jgi:hypothetical protein
MPFGFNGGKPQDTITGIHESVQFRTPIILDVAFAIPPGKSSTARQTHSASS